MKMNKRGFTLAELLTVVAILAIVVMISIPLISGRIDEAQASTCRTNRQAMTQGTATISITEKLDWKNIPNLSEENIITYLIEQGYISEAPYCPSKGQIKVSQVHSDAVYFKCSLHDDGIDPGEEDSPEILDKGAKDLEDAVNRTINTSGLTSNKNIMDEFIKNGDMDKMKVVNLSPILTDKKIEEIVNKLLSLPDTKWSNKEKLTKSLVDLRTSQTRLLPYYSSVSKKVITYVTSEDNYNAFLKVGDNKHKPTIIIYYGGNWYLYANAGGSNDTINPNKYLITTFDTTSDHIERILGGMEPTSTRPDPWFKLTNN